MKSPKHSMISLAGIVLASLAASGLGASISHADVLALYAFDTGLGEVSSPSTDANGESVATDITVGSGTRMVRSTTVNWSSSVGIMASTDLTMDGSDYWEFALTPETGFSMSLESLTLNALLNNQTGTGSLSFQYKRDGDVAFSAVGGTSYAITGDNGTSTPPTFVSVSLTSPVFQDLDGAATFRIYGLRSVYQGSIRIDNITLNGTTALSIPEPSTFGLLAALGALGFVGTSRRRR